MSLRRTCKELVLEHLPRRVLGADNPFDRLQLIVDEASQRVINSFLRVPDLSEANIVSIDLINQRDEAGNTVKREPVPDLDALYLLRPDVDSLAGVLEDFKLAAKPQHNQAHLAFTRPLTLKQLEQLASGPNLAQHVRSLVELPLSFITIQDRGFHFDMPHCVPQLFPKPSTELLLDIGHRLADVCRCLQATPTVRYGQSQQCKVVAERVQQELGDPAHRRPRLGTAGKGDVPCQLLIVDRSFDLAALFGHDYGYEALACDVLEEATLDIDRMIFVDDNGSKSILTENDFLWEQMKHEHIYDARDKVKQMTDELLESQKEQKGASDMSAGDLLNKLRQTPQLKDTIEKLLLHSTIISKINNRIVEESLSHAFGSAEQDIMCGIDPSKKILKEKDIDRCFKDTVRSRDHDNKGELTSEDKLRFLLLYVGCMVKVSDQTRNAMLDHCQLRPEDSQVFMTMLQTQLLKTPEALSGGNAVHRAVKTKQVDRFKHNADLGAHLGTQRNFQSWSKLWEPRVKDILEQLAAGTLSKDEFPLHGEEPVDQVDPMAGGGLRGAAAGFDDWSFAATVAPPAGRSAVKEAPVEVTQRYIVFVIGGLMYSELRAGAEVAKDLPAGAEVLVGGTSLLTPKRFIQMLRPRQEDGGDASDLT